MTNVEPYSTGTTMRREAFGCRAARMLGDAAGRLKRSARYVGEHDTVELLEDARRVVRHNPVPALLSAAAVGLTIGWALRK